MTGAGITWNYSALVPHSQGVDTFMSVTSTPFAYQLFFNNNILYPAYVSTVAQPGTSFPSLGGVSITDVINYYKDEASNYESVGYGADINSFPTSVKDDTIDVIYNFPMNYGNKDSCYSRNGVSVAALAFYSQLQYRVNHVDGWGTLITPYGTFSTLRVETQLYTTDSVYIDALGFGIKTPETEQIQYKWLANGQHVPVLQINETTGAGATRQYIYRDSMRNGLLAVSEIKFSLNNVSLYPNPAGENTTLNYSLANASFVNISVYSVDGRCVSKIFNGEQSTGQHNINVNVSSIQTGIYLLEIEANGEKTLKKLVVVK
jgi:hypothetical protein